MELKMVYWITGKSSAGKTVYAKRLKRFFTDLGEKALLLDGDEVRDQFTDQEYTDDSRFAHIMKIAHFASIAEKQGFIVIIAVISPKKEWRMKARKLFEKSMLIYMPGGHLWEGTEYEEPDHEEMMCEG
jgi:adenylylsulfate kinase